MMKMMFSPATSGANTDSAEYASSNSKNEAPIDQSAGGSAIAVESQRRISPLVLAVFVLITGFAALVGWLQLSYEDAEPSAVAIPVEKSEVVFAKSEAASVS